MSNFYYYKLIIFIQIILVFTLTACANRSNLQGKNTSQKLPIINIDKGKNVHILVSGSTDNNNDDLKFMLLGYLRNKFNLTPVDNIKDADTIIKIELGEISSQKYNGTNLSGMQALAGTATGAGLGALLGNAFSSKSNNYTGIGAAAGALVGLGAIWLDNTGQYTNMTLPAKIGFGKNGQMPTELNSHNIIVEANIDGSESEEPFYSLEEQLCQEILNALY